MAKAELKNAARVSNYFEHVVRKVRVAETIDTDTDTQLQATQIKKHLEWRLWRQ